MILSALSAHREIVLFLIENLKAGWDTKKLKSNKDASKLQVYWYKLLTEFDDLYPISRG